MQFQNRQAISQISNKIRQEKFTWVRKYGTQPVFHNSIDGIVLIDLQKNIRLVNQSFQAIFGSADPDLLLGREILEIVSPAHKETLISILELYEVIQAPILPIEVEIFDRTNNLIPVYVWIAATNHGSKKMMQLCIRDISEWKRVQTHLIQTNLELGDAYRDTLEGWGRALELRDHETEGHTRRVSEEAVRLALAMGVSVEDIYKIRNGAMLHDIGKMGIPDSILLKPGPLNAEEWRIMKMHPIYARDMLSDISFLKPAIKIPYYHHEKWDGTGYPEGLKGQEIPFEARLFTIIDVWDALLSDRPYRKAWERDDVLQYIWDNKTIFFDPEITDVFLDIQQ